MIRRYLEELSVVFLDADKNEISLEYLYGILGEKRSDVIYFTVKKKLYGMVSSGDIKRCKSGIVKINKNFTYITNWNSVQARETFRENSKINKIPVVDNNGCLLGDYSRWDDKRWFRRHKKCEQVNDSFRYIEYENIFLVYPERRKLEMFEYERKVFDKENIKYIICDNKNILSYLIKGNIFVFVDMDELCGIRSIYSELINRNKIEFFTFKTLSEKAATFHEEAGVLDLLMKKGIKCCTLSLGNQDSLWYQNYCSEQSKRSRNIAGNTFTSKELAKAFFEELYSDKYYDAIFNISEEMYCLDGVNKLKDVNSEYRNVFNGQRATIGQPEIFEKTVYFFGPCIVIGSFVEDKFTIESFLQEKLNKIGMYRVMNCGAYNEKKVDIKRILETDFKTGDIVVVWSNDENFHGIPDLNLIAVGEKYQIPVEWTVNTLPHCNHKVNKILADEIFSMIRNDLEKEVSVKSISTISIQKEYIMENYIKRYFSGFDYKKYDRIGSIVMNCNPFTKGHRYLIEQAYSNVDFLIIFVVEEDKSHFSFEERFEMVQEGASDLEQCMVVPSGKFILSQTTFPEYFLKIEDEDIVHNVGYDITLFADYIANELHITHRFVGEEPNDRVTNEYNNAMKRILPKKGIQLVEIERKMENGVCISASEVRRNMGSSRREEAFKLVPETTRKVLEGD